MEDKRTILLEAALELFAKNGFWNTSTAQVAREAGVATGTLFNYFPSKDILITEVLMKLKRDMFAAMHNGLDTSADVRTQLKHMWDHAGIWVRDNKKHYILLEQLVSSEQITPEAFETLKEDYIPSIAIISRGIQQGTLIGTDERYLFTIMLKIGQATLERITAIEIDDSQKQKIMDEGFQIFWNGVSK